MKFCTFITFIIYIKVEFYILLLFIFVIILLSLKNLLINNKFVITIIILKC